MTIRVGDQAQNQDRLFNVPQEAHQGKPGNFINVVKSSFKCSTVVVPGDAVSLLVYQANRLV